MSRQHWVTWRCDRCGTTETVAAKSDQRIPDGWRKLKPPEGMELDLCAECGAMWTTAFGVFFERFTGKPVVEEHTVIDDELSELDPEVNDEA